MNRHPDFPVQFEKAFLKSGYDPDTVGRAIAKDAHNSVKGLHVRKGWPSHGGAWNYQWYHFFHNEKIGPHLDSENVEGSLQSFLNQLRNSDNPNDWPFQP